MTSDFSRKDIKRQDDFQRGAVQAVQWLMQRRKSIGIGLLIVFAIASVLFGVRTYRHRQETNAAALLAVALRTYAAPVEGDAAGAAPVPVAMTTYPDRDAKLDASVDALQAVIDRYGVYPSGRAASFYQASALLELGRTDEAEAAFRAASESSSPLVRSMASLRLAQLLLDAERGEEATAVFDGLLARPPSGFPIAEALIGKARAHEAAGDEQAAMLAYQRVAEEHEGSLYALPARTRAEELAAVLGVDLDAES